MLNLAGVASQIGGRVRALPLARRVILLTLVLLAAVYASNALILTRYYAALSARERDARDAKAQLLAEHAGRAMAAVDLSLETIAEALKARLPLSRPTVLTQLLLDKYRRNLPQVRALFVAGADGRVLNTSRRFPPPRMNVSDQPYFAEQKKWRGVGLYLDRIAISPIDHKPFFAMSRPLLDDDGNFHGIVAAITDPQYFAQFYDLGAGRANETVLLERNDGVVLAGAGMPYQSLAAPARRFPHRRERARTAVAGVHGFPARIVLIGKPILVLPQFTNFLALDLELLFVMTAMALYLAATAAREAGAVDREARARRTAEARLLSAIESAPAGFALYDQEDRLVLSNGLYRSFFAPVEDWIQLGRSRKELRETAVARGILLDPGAIAAEAGPLPRQGERNAADPDEPTLRLCDGRWLLMRERRTKNGDTVVFFSDITSLKQHQEELERLTETQRLFVDALEHIPSGLMLCDSEDRLVFCNSATRQYFPNVAHLLVPGTPFETLVRAQVGSRYLPSAVDDPEQWIAERMAQHRAGTTNAVRAYADGRWAQIVERRTESGCTISIRTDITEIKQKEEVQRLFVDALEHIPSGLMLCDSEDRLVFCNSATRQYFPNVAHLLVPGTPFETLVRAQVGSRYLPSAVDDPEQWIAERMAQHRAGTTNAVRAYADGRWAQIVERRTESGCTIGIRTDITEIKQKEEALRLSEEAERAARQTAEQANQTKNVFLANMSHELRTPLNAIIGFSEMISLKVKGPLPEIYRGYGEIVCASGRHLLSIISDMLDIAKLNSGKTELNLEPVAVGAVIAQAVSMVSERAERARVRIVLALDARCPEIEADCLRLRQVVLNLLSNAVKFTPPGGQVEVSTTAGASELRIAVSDTGIGMAPEDIPRALEPFTQVGKNEKAAGEGTGLGLPIAKSLVVLHGGRFDIASAPRRGTTVTISLPLRRKDAPAAPAPAWDLAV
jgi:signal transduction histidine kinase